MGTSDLQSKLIFCKGPSSLERPSICSECPGLRLAPGLATTRSFAQGPPDTICPFQKVLSETLSKQVAASRTLFLLFLQQPLPCAAKVHLPFYRSPPSRGREREIRLPASLPPHPPLPPWGPRSSHPLLGCRWRGCFRPAQISIGPPPPPTNRPRSSPTPALQPLPNPMPISPEGPQAQPPPGMGKELEAGLGAARDPKAVRAGKGGEEGAGSGRGCWAPAMRLSCRMTLAKSFLSVLDFLGALDRGSGGGSGSLKDPLDPRLHFWQPRATGDGLGVGESQTRA